MIVYSDTSFLISYLNEDDDNYLAARALAGRFSSDDFIICEVHLLELPAAIRAATHKNKNAIPAHIARRVINRFDRSVTGKIFIKKQVNMADSAAMARRLAKPMAGRSVTPHLIYGTWRRPGLCRQAPF